MIGRSVHGMIVPVGLVTRRSSGDTHEHPGGSQGHNGDSHGNQAAVPVVAREKNYGHHQKEAGDDIRCS